MFFFALRRFISRTRKTAPTKGRTHRQTKPRLLFVIYILSHLIFIVNCFSPQKKIIFGRLCSSSHIIVAYYSRIISRSGKTHAIFLPGAPIFARFTRKRHTFSYAHTRQTYGCYRFFTFHSALAVLSFIRLLPFSRIPPLPFFLSFGSCRFPACRRCRFIFHSALAVLPFREISEGFFVALEAFARYGFFGDIG